MPNSIRLNLAVCQVQGTRYLDLTVSQIQGGMGLAHMLDTICLCLAISQVQGV